MLREQVQMDVQRACVTVAKLVGRGVLIPGNLILTAAHCLNYTTDGSMVLGDYFIEDIQTEQGLIKATPYAIEPVADIALLGAPDSQEFFHEAIAFDEFCQRTKPVPLCGSDFPVFEPFPIYIINASQKVSQNHS